MLGYRHVTHTQRGDGGAKSGHWHYLWVDCPEIQGQVATGRSFNSNFPNWLFCGILYRICCQVSFGSCLFFEPRSQDFLAILWNPWYPFQCIPFLLQLTGVSFPCLQPRTLISPRTGPDASVTVTQTLDYPKSGTLSYFLAMWPWACYLFPEPGNSDSNYLRGF